MDYLPESKLTETIIISGKSGSGKTTLSQWLAPRFNARVLNAGDVVLRTVLAHDLAPTSRADAGRLFIENFGELALGPLLLHHLRPSERLIIDGLRLPFAKELLLDRLQQTFHIHLEATEEVRQRRLMFRDGFVDVSGHAEAFLPDLKQGADLVIVDLELCEFPHCSTPPHRSMKVFGDSGLRLTLEQTAQYPRQRSSEPPNPMQENRPWMMSAAMTAGSVLRPASERHYV